MEQLQCQSLHQALSDEKAARMMGALREGQTLRSFGVKAQRPSIAFELGPDAGEGGQRSIVIEREPDDVFFLGLGVRLRRVFGKAVERD